MNRNKKISILKTEAEELIFKLAKEKFLRINCNKCSQACAFKNIAIDNLLNPELLPSEIDKNTYKCKKIQRKKLNSKDIGTQQVLYKKSLEGS